MSIQGDVATELNNATQLVVEKWSEVKEWIGDYQEALDGYLGDLVSSGSSMFTPSWPGLDIPKDVPSLGLEYMTPVPTMDALPDAPAEPADPVYPSMPPEPSYTFPSIPDMHEIIIPEMPAINMPVFSGLLPVDASIVPNPVIVNGGEGYNSQLLDALRAKLISRIVDGGTGLSPEIETAIFERNLERDELALADAVEKMLAEQAKRGFSLPPGTMIANMTQLHTEFLNKRTDTSRDIAIKQAELEQKNISESITQGIDLEGKTIDLSQRIAERVFQHSKAVADSSIEVCKLWIQKYNAALEGYKTQAQVYTQLIQAESLKVETYKTEISALQLIAQIDATLVERYKAQLEGVKTLLDTYRVQMEVVKTFVDTERAKIENYKARVDAYVAKINGITGEYTARMQGYKTRLDAYVGIGQANVQAISVRNQAYASENEAEIKALEVSLQTWVQNKMATMKGAETAASVIAAVLQGAMAGMSVQAHISGSGSASESYSESKSMSA